MKAWIVLSLGLALVPAMARAAEQPPDSTLPIASYFEIGERLTSETSASGSPAVTELKSGAQVNSHSIVAIRMRSEGLKVLGLDLVLVADLQKRGESTWSRIRTINPLSRRVMRSSSYLPGHYELLSAGPLPPLYVNDAVCDLDSFIHEGEAAVSLMLADASSDTAYFRYLVDAVSRQRTLLSVNLQELSLTTTGSATELYRARDGDRLRVKILVAAQSPPQARNASFYRTLSDTAKALYKAAARSLGSDAVSGKRGRELFDICLDETYGKGSRERSSAKNEVSTIYPTEVEFIIRMLEDRIDPYSIRFSDVVTQEEEVAIRVTDFGFKLDVSPVIAYGRLAGPDGTVDGLNPIKTTASVGTNIYLNYDGRAHGRAAVNWLPGVHMSLLGVGNSGDAKFTLALAHPVIPSLRHYFGVFFGWYDLRGQVWGFTFSPNINFRGLVGKAETGSGGTTGDAK